MRIRFVTLPSRILHALIMEAGFGPQVKVVFCSLSARASSGDMPSLPLGPHTVLPLLLACASQCVSPVLLLASFRADAASIDMVFPGLLCIWVCSASFPGAFRSVVDKSASTRCATDVSVSIVSCSASRAVKSFFLAVSLPYFHQMVSGDCKTGTCHHPMETQMTKTKFTET